MKKYRFSTLLLGLSLVLSLLLAVPASADEGEGNLAILGSDTAAALLWEEPELTARHALLMDADYGEVLLDRGGDQKAYPASITKVMTALLVLEAIDRGELAMDQVITASDTFQTDLTADSSTQNIRPGEQLTVHQLLQCLLIASANESANILAQAVCGDIPTFVERMNQRARELGCEHTHFVNTHGLHDEEHYTTTHDIYRFVLAALEYDSFREIVSTADCYIDATNLSKQRHFFNTNGLLSNLKYAGYVYPEAIGVKTGSTDAAGLCLVAAAEKNDRLLISVILGTQREEGTTGSAGYRQFSESKTLLEWGFANFSRRTLLDPMLPLGEVKVTLSKEAESVTVHPAATIERTVHKDLPLDQLTSRVTLFTDTVEAPVEEGQVMGRVTLSYGDTVYGTVDLVATNSVSRDLTLYRLDRVEKFLVANWTKLLAVIILLPTAILILCFVIFRRKKTRRYGRAVRSGGRYTGRRK